MARRDVKGGPSSLQANPAFRAAKILRRDIKHEIQNSEGSRFQLQLYAPFTKAGRCSFNDISAGWKLDFISPQIIHFDFFRLAIRLKYDCRWKHSGILPINYNALYLDSGLLA